MGGHQLATCCLPASPRRRSRRALLLPRLLLNGASWGYLVVPGLTEKSELVRRRQALTAAAGERQGGLYGSEARAGP